MFLVIWFLDLVTSIFTPIKYVQLKNIIEFDQSFVHKNIGVEVDGNRISIIINRINKDGIIRGPP